MIKVTRLPDAFHIPMQRKTYAEIARTFQLNFKTLVDFYRIPFEKISYDQDIALKHVVKIYKGEYETLSPFIMLSFASYFSSAYYEITHHKIVVIEGKMYYS